MAHAQKKRTSGGHVRWLARWRDGSGKERSKSFDRRGQALQYAFEAERDARDRPDLAEVRRTCKLGDWLDRWLDEVVRVRVEAGRLAPRTAGGYESNVRVHLMPRLGHLLLKDLRVADVDRLMDGIMASGRSGATANQVRAVLSAALTEAGRADLVDRNVARLARPPTTRRSRISTFDDDECDRILDAAGRHRLGSAIAFGLLTGLRRSELAGLKWADVDLEAGFYQGRRSAHRIGAHAERVAPTGLIESAPKTETSGRRTPMSRLAVTVLVDQRRQQAKDRLAAEVWQDSSGVWTTSVGTGVEPRMLGRALDEILEEAGVDRTSPVNGKGRGLHELRHTWTERLRRAGVPIEDAVALGRWSDAATMLHHYAATPDERLRAAVERSSRTSW